MNPMPSKLIQIPEEALHELLLKAGETIEFLNLQNDKVKASQKYQKRAKSAYWSIWWLASSTIISLISFYYEHDLEDLISVILLGIMTGIEFNVRRWFIEYDVRASIYGYWNQVTFAILFLIYGTYHYFTITLSPEILNIIGGNAQLEPIILQMSKTFYIAVGIGGGLGQYFLARYYKYAITNK